MLKAKDVIGLPVISVDTGKRVGYLHDMKFGSDWKLKSITLETKSWFAAGICVPAEQVVAIGDGAVIIQSENALVPQEKDGSARTLTEGPGKLLGLPVVSTNGEQLGVIEDVYIQPNLGKQLISCELSEGFISDLQEGRKLLPIPEQAVFGEDAIIVPPDCKNDVQGLFVSHEEGV